VDGRRREGRMTVVVPQVRMHEVVAFDLA
jgi:hypothetical protein